MSKSIVRSTLTGTNGTSSNGGSNTELITIVVPAIFVPVGALIPIAGGFFLVLWKWYGLFKYGYNYIQNTFLTQEI